jgi:hypothetical protein
MPRASCTPSNLKTTTRRRSLPSRTKKSWQVEQMREVAEGLRYKAMRNLSHIEHLL